MRPLNTFEDMPPEPNKTPPFFFISSCAHQSWPRAADRHNSAPTGQQMLCDRLPERCSGDRSSSLGVNQIVPPVGFTLKPSWNRLHLTIAPGPGGDILPRRRRCQTERWQCRDIIILSSSIQSASAHGPPTSLPHHLLLLLGKQCQTNTYWE